ncbi:MAG TPA: LysR family transcriptional regulator [Kofleriaceae bacterium]|jgi:DNA-binding transcriptional LysR family regulator
MDLLAKMATYVRVIEAGTLSAAARQLHVSTAAVSRQLTTLEDEIGTQLVARTTRSMKVTPAGQQYYERCLRILRDVEDAQSVGRARGLSGVVKVSAPITFGLATVVPKIRALAAAHPQLRVDLRLDDRNADLALEDVDVALRVGSAPPLTTELVAHKLYEWRRIAVASPAYLRRMGTPKTPAALAKHEALTHAVWLANDTWSLTDGTDVERVHVDVRFSSNVAHVLRDLALDGRGIAMLPPWFVTEELAEGTLRHVLPAWTSKTLVVHALYRTMHRQEQRVRTLIEHLRAAYATDP